MGLGRVTSNLFTHTNLHQHNVEAPLVLWQATGDLELTKLTMARTKGTHHLPPYSILCTSLRGPHPNGFLSHDSQVGVSKLPRLELLQLCEAITSCSDLRSGWGLKQSYNSRGELSNNVSHTTYTHGSRVDSRLFVVGTQIVSLTPNLSFCHNLCCKCPNGSCEPILDIYTSIAFRWYK